MLISTLRHFVLTVGLFSIVAIPLKAASEKSSREIPADAKAREECALGNKKLEQENFTEAEDAFKHAIAAQPSLAEAHLGLGKVYFHLRNPSAAIDAFSECIRLAPDSAEAYACRGYYRLLNKTDLELAAADLSRALELTGASPQKSDWRLLQRKKGRTKSDNDSSTLDWAGVAKHRNETLALAFFERASEHRIASRFDEALANYQQILLVRPDDAISLRARAAILLVQKNFPAAIADFTRVLEKIPREAGAYEGLIQAHSAQGEFNAGIAVAQRALSVKAVPLKTASAEQLFGGDPNALIARASRHEIDEAAARIHWLLGRLYVKAGNSTEAMKAFDESVRLDRSSGTSIVVDRATLREQTGALTDALSDYGTICLSYRDSASLKNQPLLYSLHALMRGKAGEAIASLNKVIEEIPTRALAWLLRGDAHFLNRDFAAALHDYDQALSLHADLPEARYHRGLVRHIRGDLQGALDDYGTTDRTPSIRTLALIQLGSPDPLSSLQQEASKIPSNYPDIISQHLLGKVSDAKLLAKQSEPNVPFFDALLRTHALFNIALLQLERGETEKARATLRQYLEIRPHGPDARRHMVREVIREFVSQGGKVR